MTGCTFHELVTIPRSLTLVGATIDATGLSVALQKGALTVASNDVTLRDVRVTGSSGAGLDISGFGRVNIVGGRLDNNREEGYHITRGFDIVFDGTLIDHNNVAKTVDPLWEAGGGKATNSQRVTFRNCEVSWNYGPGIWFDIAGNNAVVTGNRIHDNAYSGVMFEISDTASITNNAVWENGWSDTRGWGWPAGILVSTAANATVTGNTVAWSAVGISIVSQSRSDFTAPQTGNSATGNLIAVTSGHKAVGYYLDWASPYAPPVISPNATATSADLTAAGIPTSGH